MQRRQLLARYQHASPAERQLIKQQLIAQQQRQQMMQQQQQEAQMAGMQPGAPYGAQAGMAAVDAQVNGPLLLNGRVCLMYKYRATVFSPVVNYSLIMAMCRAGKAGGAEAADAGAAAAGGAALAEHAHSRAARAAVAPAACSAGSHNVRTPCFSTFMATGHTTLPVSLVHLLWFWDWKTKGGTR